MNDNPWKNMTLDEARAYDERKESGPYRHEVWIKRRIIWNLLKKHLPEDRSTPILDLGGGTGVWSIRLAREGYDVLLTDVCPSFLARAKEKLDILGLTDKVTISEADMSDLSGFSHGRFNLVLALGDPLSYCHDPQAALKGIRSITAAGGGVLIGDVESRYAGLDARRAQGWEDVFRIFEGGPSYWPGTRSLISAFTPTEVSTFVESGGWELQSMYPSDVLSSLLDKELMDSLLCDGGMTDEIADRWVKIEEHLRKDPHLLGCGREIQFVARNP